MGTPHYGTWLCSRETFWEGEVQGRDETPGRACPRNSTVLRNRLLRGMAPSPILKPAPPSSGGCPDIDGDQGGAVLEDGVRRGRNGAVLHGDLAALSADPHASGSWVLIGLNLPPPGLWSFVPYLCCYILRRRFCDRHGAEGFWTFSPMCSQQPLDKALSLRIPI